LEQEESEGLWSIFEFCPNSNFPLTFSPLLTALAVLARAVLAEEDPPFFPPFAIWTFSRTVAHQLPP